MQSINKQKTCNNNTVWWPIHQNYAITRNKLCPFNWHLTCLTFQLFEVGSIIYPTYHYIDIPICWHSISKKTIKTSSCYSSDDAFARIENLNTFMHLFTYLYVYLCIVSIHLFVLRYIKTSECDIRFVLKTIVYKKTDQWYIEWQRVTTNGNQWYNE